MEEKVEVIEVGEPLPKKKSFFIEPAKQKIWKQIVYFLVGLLLFQGIGAVLTSIIKVYVDDGSITNIVGAALVNFLAYGIEFLILACLTIGDYKNIFKNFKSWKPYVFGIAGLFTILSINAIYSTVLAMAGINITDNQNESAITQIVTSYPLLSLLIFGILGPICEELTYRAGLFSLVRRWNKAAAYIITILVFAFIHFDFGCFLNGTVLNEFLNLPLYFTAAFVFTFLFDKFGFGASITSHVTNNLLSLAINLIAPFFQQ